MIIRYFNSMFNFFTFSKRFFCDIFLLKLALGNEALAKFVSTNEAKDRKPCQFARCGLRADSEMRNCRPYKIENTLKKIAKS